MNYALALIFSIFISFYAYAEITLNQRFNQYMQAFVGQDISAVKSFIFPNGFSVKSTTGDIETKDEWLKILEERNERIKSKNSSLEVTITYINIEEKDSDATVQGDCIFHIGYMENDEMKIQDSKVHFIQAWKKINGTWYLASVSNNTISSAIREPNKSHKGEP